MKFCLFLIELNIEVDKFPAIILCFSLHYLSLMTCIFCCTERAFPGNIDLLTMNRFEIDIKQIWNTEYIPYEAYT